MYVFLRIAWVWMLLPSTSKYSQLNAKAWTSPSTAFARESVQAEAMVRIDHTNDGVADDERDERVCPLHLVLDIDGWIEFKEFTKLLGHRRVVRA